MDMFIPTSIIPRRHSHLPKWFNRSIRHHLKQLRSLKRTYVSNPTLTRMRKISNLELNLQEDISEAKHQFVSTLIKSSAAKESTAPLHKHIRSRIKQTGVPQSVFWASQSALPTQPITGSSLSYLHFTDVEVIHYLTHLRPWDPVVLAPRF